MTSTCLGHTVTLHLPTPESLRLTLTHDGEAEALLDGTSIGTLEALLVLGVDDDTSLASPPRPGEAATDGMHITAEYSSDMRAHLDGRRIPAARAVALILQGIHGAVVVAAQGLVGRPDR